MTFCYVTSSFTKNDRNVNKLCSTLQKKLDPVSRVTGIPGWYWILGIKCSDTTGVGLVYWNSELKFGQGHTPVSKQRVIFCRLGGLLETLQVVYILTKGKKSSNAEKNENVELPHTQLSYSLPSVTQSLFRDQPSRLFALLWKIPGPFLDENRS